MLVNSNYLLAEQNSASILHSEFFFRIPISFAAFSHDFLFCAINGKRKAKIEFNNYLYEHNIDGRKNFNFQRHMVSGGQGSRKHRSSSLCLRI